MLESGVDGEGSLLMQYPEKEAVIMYSKITNSSLPSEIQGEDGSIVIDKLSTMKGISIHYRDGTKEDITVPQLPNDMFYEVKEFIDLIQHGKTESSTNSHAHSLASLQIMDEARQQFGLTFPND